MLQHPAPGKLVAAAWTADYRVAFLNPEGDTIRVIEREHDAVPLGDAEWEAGLEPFRSFVEEWPTASCQPRSPSKPERKPAISNLLVDLRGRVWVETSTERGDRWEIFAGDGSLIGSLPSFPGSASTPPYLSSHRIVYVIEDSVGVQRVQVLEIVR